ncbi:hypothetical protein AB0F91_44625 [Amycolatopsis sp. NPDC023774]|uniref:hypothetical protein n=1 Tax=Amycolatopsis sp. NPDC023774 TaxID=3155015 RepID=UPI0033E68867
MKITTIEYTTIVVEIKIASQTTQDLTPIEPRFSPKSPQAIEARQNTIHAGKAQKEVKAAPSSKPTDDIAKA